MIPAVCDCLSHNRPDWGGTEPEVILDPRGLIDGATKTVCVDACIADQIMRLWRRGIATKASCCGHNQHVPLTPMVVLANPSDASMAADILADDGRQWFVVIMPDQNTREEPKG